MSKYDDLNDIDSSIDEIDETDDIEVTLYNNGKMSMKDLASRLESEEEY